MVRARAESMFQVRGENQGDRTEPVHSNTYDFPPVPDEADIADLRHRLARAGLTPVSLPLGVDVERWLAHGATPWDAFLILALARWMQNPSHYNLR